jgi:hypothetical protein
VPSSPPAAIDRAGGAAEARPCAISMRVTGLRSLAKRRYLSVALRTDRACRVTVAATGFKKVTARLVPNERTVVRIRRTKGTAKRIVVTAGTAKQTVRAR